MTKHDNSGSWFFAGMFVGTLGVLASAAFVGGFLEKAWDGIASWHHANRIDQCLSIVRVESVPDDRSLGYHKPSDVSFDVHNGCDYGRPVGGGFLFIGAYDADGVRIHTTVLNADVDIRQLETVRLSGAYAFDFSTAADVRILGLVPE